MGQVAFKEQRFGPEPHADRGRRILADHPELRLLMGPSWFTGGFIVMMVTLQTALAMFVAGQGTLVILGTAFCIGAIFNLGCWALIHEGTHNLIARSNSINQCWSIAANLPILVPAAANFRTFHRAHHLRQGEEGWDVDLPMVEERAIVRTCPLRKALWLATYMPVQVIRAARAPQLSISGGWMWANIFACGGYAVLLWSVAGVGALAYLLLSSWFAMGLHPLGARWVSEHFTLRPGQETNSYYGSLNRLLFNCGYHQEHHDLPGVPWYRLPEVRRVADAHYRELYAVRSWTALLLRFLFDRQLTLRNRVVRSRG